MQTPGQSPHPEMPPGATQRRTRLLAAAGTAVVVSALAVVYVVRSSGHEAKAAGGALSGLRTPVVQVQVRGHSKMQAFGPNWSLHRAIDIASYVREGVANAA